MPLRTIAVQVPGQGQTSWQGKPADLISVGLTSVTPPKAKEEVQPPNQVKPPSIGQAAKADEAARQVQDRSGRQDRRSSDGKASTKRNKQREEQEQAQQAAFCKTIAEEMCNTFIATSGLSQFRQTTEQLCDTYNGKTCPSESLPACAIPSIEGMRVGCSEDVKHAMFDTFVRGLAKKQHAKEEAERQAKEAEERAEKICYSMTAERTCGRSKGKMRSGSKWQSCKSSCESKSPGDGFKCTMSNKPEQFHFAKMIKGNGCVWSPQVWIEAKKGQRKMKPECADSWKLCRPDAASGSYKCPAGKGVSFIRGLRCTAEKIADDTETGF